MYKNFKLTESEKEQILNMHKEHGYKKPLNEFGGYGFKKGDDKDIEWIIKNRMDPAFKKAFSPMERLNMPLDDEEKLYLYIKSNIDRDDLQDGIAHMKKLIKKDKVDSYIRSKKSLKESFDDLSDEIEPYSKFESSDELLMSIKDRLANALQMQEWSLVEEVTSDVFNYVKNKMGDSSEDDRDMPGFEGTMDSLNDVSIR